MTNSERASVRSEVSTRRDFLRATVAGSMACALSACDLLSKRGPEPIAYEGAVDAHVHVWTPDTERYPLAAGYAKNAMRPVSFTPQDLFVHSVTAGVSRVVLIQMSFYGFDNSYMLDTIEAYPGVFSGVAVIDENAAPVVEMKSLESRGVRGFRIRPGKQSPDSWLDSDGMRAMWSRAAESRQNIGALINPEFLPSIDRMCERYPETPVVIDHFGRIGIDGSMPEDQLDDLCRLARHEHVKVKVSAYYALGKRKPPYRDLAPMIRRVYDAFGPQRLMWASDCPFQVVGDHDYASSIDLIRELSFLSATDREWILRRSAEDTYF